MCAICGIIRLDKQKLEETKINDMSETMEHRGPDDMGVFINPSKNVGLGFRRLSIIDIKNGNQPIKNNSNHLAIVFNGEIYNHKSLRKRLVDKGHVFKTNTDSESIIIGYEEWGQDVVNKLRGMFAFAIWDENKQILFMARDRLGIKPLYYFIDKRKFIFSSEIKSILHYINKKLPVNQKALYHYLTLAATPAPMTMFKGINKLEPGASISVNIDGGMVKKFYWKPHIFINEPKLGNDVDIIEGVKARLRESIKLRMMSEVPVGVFLSGGLDSSLNVALMSELVAENINTFSVSIKGDDLSDESDEARYVSNYFNTKHHEIEISSDDIISFLPKMVKFQDEPLADPVCVPLYFVSKLARENGVYVIQVGEGADEIFFGYTLYAKMSRFYNRFYKTFMDMPDFIKNIGMAFGSIFIPEKKNKYIKWAVENRELFIGGNSVFLDREKNNLLKVNHGYNTYTQIVKSFYDRLNSKTRGLKFENKMILMELKHRLPELLLMRIDKMSMSTSVETRAPYLDHHLVEYVLKNVPQEMKFQKGITKYVLRKVAEDFLPEKVINRKKMGFCGSASNILSNPVIDYAESVIKESDWMNQYFDMNKIEPMFEEHKSKKADRGMKIFTLLNLSLWQKHWYQN